MKSAKKKKTQASKMRCGENCQAMPGQAKPGQCPAPSSFLLPPAETEAEVEAVRIVIIADNYNGYKERSRLELLYYGHCLVRFRSH